MEKNILKGIGVVVLFLILIQCSIFVFNNVNAWLGIGCGVVSIGVTYALARVIIKSVTKK